MGGGGLSTERREEGMSIRGIGIGVAAGLAAAAVWYLSSACTPQVAVVIGAAVTVVSLAFLVVARVQLDRTT
jgi:hypothetical protein